MTAPAEIAFARAPQTRNELWLAIKALWGIELPRKKICEDHTSPFEAVAHAYFGEHPNYAVWYASRGSGKSQALATLGLTKAFLADIDVTILGGSMTQSLNVRAHMRKLMQWRNAPRYAVHKDTATVIELNTGKAITPLPASQTTVRGPHPPLQLLDEVDEMELAIYDAALGQAMEQINSRGEVIGEYIVASSTWQNPEGTFSEVIDRARERGMPIFTWCWRELLEPHGWMTQRFVDAKRATVSAQMWKTEYELNEPTSASRAIDLDKVDEFFVEYPDLISHVEHGDEDEEWIWENPDPLGEYAAGADWAKERDKTVIVVCRIDVTPRKIVYLRIVNKRPYPTMMGWFDDAVTKYHARGAHDKTGLGNVVHDMLETTMDDQVMGFNFTGRQKRSQMLLHYIADFEHGGYLLPRQVKRLFRAHRAVTNDDVYGNHKILGGHLPDEISSMGLMHHAAGRIPGPMEIQDFPKDNSWRKVTKPLNEGVEQDGAFVLNVGDVSVVDERYDEGGLYVPDWW